MADSPPDAYTLDPDEVARMERVARDGQLERVDTWVEGILEAAEKHDPHRRGWPPEVKRTLDDLYDVAAAVDLARRGRQQELRDFLAVLVMERDGASPEQEEVLKARLDKVVSVLRAQGLAPAGDLSAEPAWARDQPDTSSPEYDRLVVRLRVRSLLGRGQAGYTFDVTPTMFVMRGDLGRVRVPRSDVATLRWLIWAPGGGVTPLNRLLFLAANDRIEGYWDLKVYVHSKRVVKWLAGHGYPVEKIAGGEALDDHGALLRAQHV